MRFKQCYCILAFLRGAFASTTTWPLTESSPPSPEAHHSPHSECESRVYSSNRSQIRTCFLSTVYLAAIRTSLIFSCLPCLAPDAISYLCRWRGSPSTWQPAHTPTPLQLSFCQLTSSQSASSASALPRVRSPRKEALNFLGRDWMFYHYTVD
jgi:hypothetical protein